tara:strand:- start:61 stop:642 length:582 start_codon:yes stop_codon:yes gene_type:complete
MSKIIKNHFQNIINTLNKTKIDIKIIIKISEKLISSIKSKKKIFVYGNGGSFADSSHFVGELTATYNKIRKPLPFYLLGSNMASVSAWANDFEFNDYVSRELSGYSIRNDVLIILSTSGGNIKQNQSLNLIKLAKNAKSKGVFIISLLGKGGGEVSKISDLSIIVDSNTTSTIQEMHKIILHSICEYIDSKKI